jgi:hypothetical protein
MARETGCQLSFLCIVSSRIYREASARKRVEESNTTTALAQKETMRREDYTSANMANIASPKVKV